MLNTSNLTPLPGHSNPLFVSGTTAIAIRRNAEDSFIQVDSSTIILTLPALSGVLQGSILNFSTQTGTMTINTSGSDTIQGGGSTITVSASAGKYLSLLANHKAAIWSILNNSVTSAQGLATSGASVSTGAAAPPTTGEGLFATSATTAAWEYTPSLGTTSTPVVVNAAAAPSVGQVLTATSGTNANWAYVGYLATTGTAVGVTANNPTIGETLVATSSSSAVWAVPQGSSLGYGALYGQAPSDYSSTIAVNAPVPFPHVSSSFGGITLNSNTTDVILPVIGTYDVEFVVSVAAVSQLTLWLDPDTGTFARLANTTFGVATAGTIIGRAVVVTTAVNSKIRVVNDTSATAITVPSSLGGTNPSTQTFIIKRIQ
jgi:hypothetical protein